MVIISDYQLIFKIEDGKKLFFCGEVKDRTPCPECSEKLKYRDSVLRTFKEEGGDKNSIIIRRLKCCYCLSLHRELPDFIAPHKHYTTDVIENVVDELINDGDYDYPCERTMIRWKNWTLRNTSGINGYLKSIAFRMLNFSGEFLESGVCLLNKLQEEGEGWLGKVLRVIYNSGGFLPP